MISFQHFFLKFSTFSTLILLSFSSHALNTFSSGEVISSSLINQNFEKANNKIQIVTAAANFGNSNEIAYLGITHSSSAATPVSTSTLSQQTNFPWPIAITVSKVFVDIRNSTLGTSTTATVYVGTSATSYSITIPSGTSANGVWEIDLSPGLALAVGESISLVLNYSGGAGTADANTWGILYSSN